MDVQDDDAFERVRSAVADAFGNDFEWDASLLDLPRKGVVRGIDQARAKLAVSLLGHLGARVLIDEDAWYDSDGWPSPTITEEQNLQDVLELVRQYLKGDGSRWNGLLTVGLYKSRGMVYRGMSRWSALPEYPNPAWDVWDEIV
jgi:hypothetical protein